ncbi:MAG: methyltransferase domain-containing protein [Mesorhizobium sp.]|nr:MAG: methyltransferase domain-containing protein [Mesorhizobium sp.]TJW31280.1 MAG: methyltransferase domain-containing protein [Mesorhizobium sp.]
MQPSTPDWGLGRYESIAAQLLPAARIVIEAARLRSGERVVDVGCGTGNAALLAAEHGTDVIGVDPAARLIQVAAGRAALQRVQATFRLGKAEALPLDDASADVILSVFGVIFASDAEAVAAEIGRVLKPDGRIAISAWVPTGTMFAMNATAAERVRQALEAPRQPQPFTWHDPVALARLLQPSGFALSFEEHELAFTAASARDFLDQQMKDHPLAVAGIAVLDKLGQAQRVHDDLLAILESGNEDPKGFRVTSRYVVATASRGAIHRIANSDTK